MSLVQKTHRQPKAVAPLEIEGAICGAAEDI